MRKLAFWSIWLLIWVMPFENLVEIPGLGTLGKIFAMVAIAVGLVGIVVLQSGLRWSLFHWVLLVFVLWSATAFFWTSDLVFSFARIKLHFQLFVMVCVIYQWVQTRSEVHKLFAAYVLGCYVALSDLILNYLTEATGSGHRFAATGFNPNDMAIILVLGIPMAWFVAQTMSGKRGAWLFRLYTFVAPLGIALTASRNGLISMVVALTYVLYSLTRMSLQKKVAILALGVATVWVGMEILPARSLERWATTGHEITAGSLNSRVGIWRSAMETFAQAPLLGVGPGAFKTAVSSDLGVEKSPHNVYISILVELGLIGFGLFLALLAVVFHAIRKMPKMERIFWTFLLGTWLIAANSLNWEWRKQTWMLLVLPVVHLASLQRKEECEEEKQLP